MNIIFPINLNSLYINKMFIVTLIDYLHESNKIGAMPQRTILKFKTIEDAYKSAFDDLDKKSGNFFNL